MGVQLKENRPSRLTWTRILVGVILTILLIILMQTFQPGTKTMPLEPGQTPAGAEEGCEEDEDCWNCQTMGNRICGPNAQPTPALPFPAEPHFAG